ncbi:unnamed protein product [Urochloa humidicola]
MEPTKQNGADPSGLGAAFDPAQLRDGPSPPHPEPTSLVEQAAPPNPLGLLQPQGDDVVGASSMLTGIPTSNGDFRDYVSTSSGWQLQPVPNFVDSYYYEAFASGAQPEAPAPFSTGGHFTSLNPYNFVPLISPFANQPAPYFDQLPSASQWASMQSSSSN